MNRLPAETALVKDRPREESSELVRKCNEHPVDGIVDYHGVVHARLKARAWDIVADELNENPASATWLATPNEQWFNERLDLGSDGDHGVAGLAAVERAERKLKLDRAMAMSPPKGRAR